MGTSLTTANASATASSERRVAAEDRILRMHAVRLRTGLGRSTIYRLIALSQFPAPVRLTGRAIGWRSVDIERWADGLPPATH